MGLIRARQHFCFSNFLPGGKKSFKHPEEFGQGAMEGVAGPESAITRQPQARWYLFWLWAFPFAPPTAMLRGGLMIHGISPGRFLFLSTPIFFGL
jgi:putative tricarboxylic transport membrane protein